MYIALLKLSSFSILIEGIRIQGQFTTWVVLDSLAFNALSWSIMSMQTSFGLSLPNMFETKSSCGQGFPWGTRLWNYVTLPMAVKLLCDVTHDWTYWQFRNVNFIKLITQLKSHNSSPLHLQGLVKKNLKNLNFKIKRRRPSRIAPWKFESYCWEIFLWHT